MVTQLFSFDIFDTCVTRHYAMPRDLFFDLAHNFFNHYTVSGYDEKDVIVFARLRRLAERQTRLINKISREDITLHHIYRQLSKLLPWDFDLAEAMNLEMKLEKSSLHTVLPIKLHIDLLRQQGHRIIFISDMYLPTNFIRECLLDKKIAEANDVFYISGDIGLRKSSGNLFRKVIELQGIQPNQLLHCGDNHHSDIKVPNQLGIQTHYFTGAHLTQFEHHAFKKVQRNYYFGNFSKLVGVSRLARLSLFDSDAPLTQQSPNNAIELKKIITTVAAPLLTAYVAWLLQDAKQRNIKRLYFVSRDGQILLKIAQKLCASIANPPELRYLYGSRRAWFLPSVFENDWSEFAWLINSNGNRVVDLLNRLSISQDEVMDYLIQYKLNYFLDYEVNNEILIKFKSFIKNPDVFNIVKNKAAQLRNNAIAYFYQEGLFDNNSWAIVDLGWQLNCQYALSKIIRSVVPRKTITGYYLAIQNNAVSFEKAGYRFAFINQSGSGFIKSSCHWLFRSNVRVMIEHLFVSADHPSVLKYQKKQNRLFPVFSDHSYELVSYLISEAIVNYANYIKSDDLFYALDHYANAAVNNAELFFTRPQRDTVNILADLMINRDLSHDQSYERKLASAMNLSQALRLLIGQGYDVKSNVWLEGSAALSSFAPRQLLLLALMGRNVLHYLKNSH
jgi:predicted HAD superfamily hydrolase